MECIFKKDLKALKKKIKSNCDKNNIFMNRDDYRRN